MAETGEGLWMSAKERDRLKVLHEVKQRHITQKQAATELGLRVRWVRKLLWRWRAGGDSALRHGLRGRASNRKTPEAVKRRAVELYRKKKQAKLWHDYGPTLAAEELAEQHGIQVSRETLRQWLIAAKLWRRRRARIEQAHVGTCQEDCVWQGAVLSYEFNNSELGVCETGKSIEPRWPVGAVELRANAADRRKGGCYGSSELAIGVPRAA